MVHSKTCSISRHMEWKKTLEIVYDAFDSFRTSVVAYNITERNVIYVTIACPQKSPNLDKHIVRLDWPDNT